MISRSVVSLVVAAAAAAPSALADTTPPAKSVTATGTGSVKVKPANRHSNASIAAAEAAAQKAAVPLAIDDAKQNAQLYASAAGLTLGSIVAVTDVNPGGPFYPPFGDQGGPFGPGKYCGTIRRPVKPIPPGPVSPRRLKFKKLHRCFVPSPATETLTVTWSAT
jgi:uncharacterized protein YggE